MVRFRLAAAAAFIMFFLAADFCFAVAIQVPLNKIPCIFDICLIA